MQKKKITFVGAGNMAEGLINGLVSNRYPSEFIFASDPSAEKLENLRAAYDIHVFQDNCEAIAEADVVVFAVKPQVLKSVMEELAETLCTLKPLVISIVAGARTTYINHCLNGQLSIVRCMPNMPALLQSGAIALFANAKVSESERDLAESIMRSVGITVWLDNEQSMDTVTALSGSGPAYFFFVMEALEKEAVAQGLSKEIAHLLTVQTALGAARVALESNETLSLLRTRITSVGGTTEQALKVFMDSDLHGILAKGMAAAKERSVELAILLES
jgi:pyrroline-5-carboxylate reductase